MHVVDFSALPLWLNVGAFALFAGVVWIAGSRLSRYADEIATRTGLAKALVGALFLGGVTSLPEMATTVFASALGNPLLAVNNLFGGVAMQVAVLAVADAALRRASLSGRVGGGPVFVQGLFLIGLLGCAALGILFGDLSIGGIGAWSIVILMLAVVAFGASRDGGASDEYDDAPRPHVRSLWSKSAVAAAAIFVAGFGLARIGDVLAEQTGLGATFVGAVLVALATSLPEVATTLSAVAIGQYTLAFSNILGTNILDMSAVFLADAVSLEGPILERVGAGSLVTPLLGILLTSIYLVGLRWKEKPVVAGMGLDSAAVIVLYLAGVALLYAVR